MITDSETNLLYLADCLPERFPVFFKQFESVLNQHKVDYRMLPMTKDIWAVDFMPIQVDNARFVQFIYNPDYLQTKSGQATISPVNEICKRLQINPTKTKIILDGGNVVRSKSRVIMTEKVFSENKHLSRLELIRQLENCLEVEDIVFIPWQQQYDCIGHADGIVRFIDDNKVFVNDYSKERTFQKRILTTLDKARIEHVPLAYYPSKKALGCYINYLQMGDILFVPTYRNASQDDEAIKNLEAYFPAVVPIDAYDIAEEDGVLNCISWNILVDKTLPVKPRARLQ